MYEFRNPAYSNEEETQIDCEINIGTENSPEWLPHTVNNAEGKPERLSFFEAIVDAGVGAYVPPPIDDLKDEALHKLSSLHSHWLVKATGSASAEERETWGVKSTAAKAWNDGTADSDQTAMLEAEATGRGSSVEALVTIILASSAAYHQLIGSARGALSAAEVAVNSATDQASIDAALSRFQDKIVGYGNE